MGLQAATDESWGLDNIAVFAGPLPPTLARGPQNQYASLGDVTTFAVRAAGSLDLSYQWFFHGAVLPAQTNATLTITNVQFTHAGAYWVRVSNPFGMVETQPVSLSIFDRKPEKSWEFATGSGISCPPAVGRDGTVYVCGSYKLYALKTSSGLAKSAWPMFRHNPRHTANAAMPFVFPPTVLAPVVQSDGTFQQTLYQPQPGTFVTLSTACLCSLPRSVPSPDQPGPVALPFSPDQQVNLFYLLAGE